MSTQKHEVTREDALRSLLALAIGASDIQYEVVETAPTIQIMLRRGNHDSLGVMGRDEAKPEDVISVADATALIAYVHIYERWGRPDRVRFTAPMAKEIRRATDKTLEQFLLLMAKHDVVPV